MQAFESFFKLFQQVTGIILAVMIDHDHFMGAGVGLGERARQVFSQVGRFIPCTDNHAYGVLLRFFFSTLTEESEPEKKPCVIKKLDNTNQTE
jgi:hypothetical protein